METDEKDNKEVAQSDSGTFAPREGEKPRSGISRRQFGVFLFRAVAFSAGSFLLLDNTAYACHDCNSRNTCGPISTNNCSPPATTNTCTGVPNTCVAAGGQTNTCTDGTTNICTTYGGTGAGINTCNGVSANLCTSAGAGTQTTNACVGGTGGPAVVYSNTCSYVSPRAGNDCNGANTWNQCTTAGQPSGSAVTNTCGQNGNSCTGTSTQEGQTSVNTCTGAGATNACSGGSYNTGNSCYYYGAVTNGCQGESVNACDGGSNDCRYGAAANRCDTHNECKSVLHGGGNRCEPGSLHTCTLYNGCSGGTADKPANTATQCTGSNVCAGIDMAVNGGDI
jgi:hypothetical protein